MDERACLHVGLTRTLLGYPVQAGRRVDGIIGVRMLYGNVQDLLIARRGRDLLVDLRWFGAAGEGSSWTCPAFGCCHISCRRRTWNGSHYRRLLYIIGTGGSRAVKENS